MLGVVIGGLGDWQVGRLVGWWIGESVKLCWKGAVTDWIELYPSAGKRQAFCNLPNWRFADLMLA
jgi:hypothetical protein